MTLMKVLKNSDIMIVNEQEAQGVSRILASLKTASLQSIAAKFGLQILITRGPEGAEFLLPSDTRLHVSSPIIDTIDTTGAGDTFCGVFAARLFEGWQVAPAIRAACEGAAKACCAVGAQTGMPFRDEILNDVDCP